MNWEKVPQELYIRLGSSGLQISKIIVGCMSFGTKAWVGDWVLEDEDEVFAVMKKAYDEGIRTYDTADTYSNGVSERLLGKFIKKYNIDRSKVVILTKVFFPAPEEYETFSPFVRDFPGHELINRCGLSRKHIIDSVAASVERLDTYIDVLQIHKYDTNTPVEETMEALNDCIKQGLARYIGASTMRAYQFIKMQNVAEKHGWAKFISMQSYYSLLYREEEEELIAYCNETGVGLIPWSPNAGGYLARPLSKQDTTRGSSMLGVFSPGAFYGLDNMTEADKSIINRVEELAKKKEVSMASVAVAWVLSKNNWPIIGFSKPERVDDALDGFRLKLIEEEIKFLEEPYVSKPLPHLYP